MCEKIKTKSLIKFSFNLFQKIFDNQIKKLN